jgi:photosystem II PsbM protein
VISCELQESCALGAGSMEVNDLGFVASILFVLVPTVFLLILFIQTPKEDR